MITLINLNNLTLPLYEVRLQRTSERSASSLSKRAHRLRHTSLFSSARQLFQCQQTSEQFMRSGSSRYENICSRTRLGNRPAMPDPPLNNAAEPAPDEEEQQPAAAAPSPADCAPPPAPAPDMSNSSAQSNRYYNRTVGFNSGSEPHRGPVKHVCLTHLPVLLQLRPNGSKSKLCDYCKGPGRRAVSKSELNNLDGLYGSTSFE